MSDLYETMRNAPTTRRYRDAPVDSGAIRRVLENARFAPSGGHRQGWRLVLVHDPGLRPGLRDPYLPRAGALPPHTRAGQTRSALPGRQTHATQTTPPPTAHP